LLMVVIKMFSNENRSESLQHDTAMDALVGNLEDKLDQKLEGFTVLDREGRLLGKVQEMVPGPSRVLNLLVSKPNFSPGTSMFLLSSKLIQAVDPHTNSLMVGITQAESQALPEYSQSAPNLPNLAESAAVGDQLRTSRRSQGSEVVAQEVVPLLEERLVVNSTRRKIGEVTVRKVVETRIVEVPVRREKLIVEQVNPQRKPLVEIDLGEQANETLELINATAQSQAESTVNVEFTSLRTASQLLEVIARQAPQGCRKVRLELVLDNPQDKPKYQAWLDRIGQTQV
jgi:stress response protein YsnF